MKVRAATDKKRGSPRRSKRTDGEKLVSPPSKPNTLKGRKFFLDLKGYRGQAALESDLRFLGATIERCFSKEVHWLITNKGKPEDYGRSRSQSREGDRQSQATPSPFNLATASPQAPSPTQPTVPLTRGKAIAQAANITKTYGTADVVENARRWRVNVVHVEGAKKWLDKEISKWPSHVQNPQKEDQARSKASKIKRLKAPFIKFEASNKHYRPVYEQLSALPVLYFESEIGQCPFELRRKRSKDETLEDQEERAEAEERDPVVPDMPIMTFSSQKEHKPSDTYNKSGHERKSSHHTPAKLVTAGELRRQARERNIADKKKGYCEMCNLKYDDIDKHVLHEQHKKYVKNTENYKALDSLINEVQTMEELIKGLLRCHQARQHKMEESNAAREKLRTPIKKHTPVKKARVPESVAGNASPSKTPMVGQVTSPSGPWNNTATASTVTSKSSSKHTTPSKARTSAVAELTPHRNLRSTPVIPKPVTPEVREAPSSEHETVHLLSLTPSNKASMKAEERSNQLALSLQTLSSQPYADLGSPTTRSRTRCLQSPQASSGAKHFSDAMASPIPSSSKTQDCISTKQAHDITEVLKASESDVLTPVRKLRKNSQSQETPAKQNEQRTALNHATPVKGILKTPLKNKVVPSPKISASQRLRENKCPSSGSKRQTRKLILKRTMSIASDSSMQRLLEDEGEQEFKGFSQKDLMESVKSNLSFTDVEEVDAELHTQSGSEWDYKDIERGASESMEQIDYKPVPDENTCPTPKDDDGLDIGSIIGNIAVMSDHSDPEWDEHLETFFSDKLTKKQDLSFTSIDIPGSSTVKSPLKVISLNSPKKSEKNSGDVYAYLSPSKGKSPARLVLSSCMLPKSPGKLVWSPGKQANSPLKHLLTRTIEKKVQMTSCNPQSSPTMSSEKKVQFTPCNEETSPGASTPRSSVLSSLRRSPRKHTPRSSRKSKSLMFSPPLRSPLFASMTPGEEVEELWAGPLQNDKSKYAKETKHYKPSTPQLSQNIEKDHTPRSYLREPLKSASVVGQDETTPRSVAQASQGVSSKPAMTSTPVRPLPNIPRTSRTSSVSKQESSTPSLQGTTDTEDNTIQVDAEISFNFNSPKKIKPIKSQDISLNSLPKEYGDLTINTSGVETCSSLFANKTMPESRDILDNLDDPNLGISKQPTQKRIFKHASNVKKAYRLQYLKPKEDKIPHWRKKYEHIKKKPVIKVSGNKRESRKVKVSEPTSPIRINNRPDDEPVSPRTRRNLLALVLGIRQHKGPSDEYTFCETKETKPHPSEKIKKKLLSETTENVKKSIPQSTENMKRTSIKRPRTKVKDDPFAMSDQTDGTSYSDSTKEVNFSKIQPKMKKFPKSKWTSPLGPYELSVSVKKLSSPELRKKMGKSPHLKRPSREKMLKRLGSFNKSQRREDDLVTSSPKERSSRLKIRQNRDHEKTLDKTSGSSDLDRSSSPRPSPASRKLNSSHKADTRSVTSSCKTVAIEKQRLRDRARSLDVGGRASNKHKCNLSMSVGPLKRRNADVAKVMEEHNCPKWSSAEKVKYTKSVLSDISVETTPTSRRTKRKTHVIMRDGDSKKKGSKELTDNERRASDNHKQIRPKRICTEKVLGYNCERVSDVSAKFSPSLRPQRNCKDKAICYNDDVIMQVHENSYVVYKS